MLTFQICFWGWPCPNLLPQKCKSRPPWVGEVDKVDSALSLLAEPLSQGQGMKGCLNLDSAVSHCETLNESLHFGELSVRSCSPPQNLITDVSDLVHMSAAGRARAGNPSPHGCPLPGLLYQAWWA